MKSELKILDADEQNHHEIKSSMSFADDFLQVDDIEYDGWRLPGTQEPYEWCGKWAINGCLNSHKHGQKNSEYHNKVFVKKFQKSCMRRSCSTCNKKALARESNRATKRVEQWAKDSGKEPVHVIISPPDWCHNIPYGELKKICREKLKKFGIIGGASIFHPFRHKNGLSYWSPHFHIVGFQTNYNLSEVTNSDGWIMKNTEKRRSVYGTFYYALEHCGIHPKFHSVTWFGELSYGKVKNEKEPEKRNCPICETKLRPVYFCSLSGHPLLEGFFEGFVPDTGWYYEGTEPQPSFEVLNETSQTDVLRSIREYSKKLKMLGV